MNNNYLNKIKEIIVEKFGIDQADVTPEAYFEDDLNISEMELLEILEELEENYQVELIDDKDEIESVGDLLDVLTEKLE